MRWFNGPHQNRVFFLLKSRRIWLNAVYFSRTQKLFTALIDRRHVNVSKQDCVIKIVHQRFVRINTTEMRQCKGMPAVSLQVTNQD